MWKQAYLTTYPFKIKYIMRKKGWRGVEEEGASPSSL